MNPASVEALEQQRGYYKEGATVATKRIRELRQALKEAEHQLEHATSHLTQIDEDLAALETAPPESARPVGVHYADSIGDEK